MELGYGEVENLLMRLLEVPEDRRGTLRSRIQYLQRLGFPAMPRLGRGARARYQPDQTLRLMIALELAELNWPAQTTAEFVDAHWLLIEKVAFDALAREVGDDRSSKTFLVMHPDALWLLRSSEAEPEVEEVSADVLMQWATGDVTPRSRGYVILDVARLAVLARKELSDDTLTDSAP